MNVRRGTVAKSALSKEGSRESYNIPQKLQESDIGRMYIAKSYERASDDCIIIVYGISVRCTSLQLYNNCIETM